MLSKKISFKALRAIGEAQAIPKFFGAYKLDPDTLCIWVAPMPFNFLFSFWIWLIGNVRYPFLMHSRNKLIANARDSGHLSGYDSGYHQGLDDGYQNGFRTGYDYAFEFMRSELKKERDSR